MTLSGIHTKHRIIFGDSREMYEVEDESVHLVVTSPPYPMIEMWDNLFRKLNPKIDRAFEKLESTESKEKKEKLVKEIYELMHETLLPVWKELYCVLVPGGIVCINIGDATLVRDVIILYDNEINEFFEVLEQIRKEREGDG